MQQISKSLIHHRFEYPAPGFVKRPQVQASCNLLEDTSTSNNCNLASDVGMECFPYEPSAVHPLFHMNFLSNNNNKFCQDLLKCIHRYASEYYRVWPVVK